MKVLTWNVWFDPHEQVERARGLMREIARRRPEVVALQEVVPALREALDGGIAGYELHGGDSAFGYDAMLMTRVPIRRFDVVELPSQMGRRMLAVELASGLTVATVHLESTKHCEAERVRQLGLIGGWLAAEAPHACLVGDMNFDDFAARESDALDDSFVDVWPLLRAGDPGYTIDSVVNTMRRGYKGTSQRRIDRVFLRSATWRATAIELVGNAPLVGPTIDDDVFVSDHFGLEVELRE